MQAELLAITGPIRGAIFRLGGDEVSIGRHASNHLCIADPSVSRRHSVIRFEGGSFRICDAGSNNGTFVNGDAVKERSLNDGDMIAIGDTVLRFALNPGAAAQRSAIPALG